jgi:hypothetical protein
MSEHEELSRKLLEENGLREGAVREADREGLRAIVKAERRRGAHVRNVMLLSWAVFISLCALFVLAYFGAEGTSPTVEIRGGTWHLWGLIGLFAMLLASIASIVALVSTIAWGLRLAFGPRRVEERLERIEAQLARLEVAQGEAERPTDAQP